MSEVPPPYTEREAELVSELNETLRLLNQSRNENIRYLKLQLQESKRKKRVANFEQESKRQERRHEKSRLSQYDD